MAFSLGGFQSDLAGRLFDRVDAHLDRVAEPERAAAAAPNERRAEIVELEVVAGEVPCGEEALEDLAEPDEEPRADRADDLALEGVVPAALEQGRVKQPGETDVVRAVLEARRLSFPCRRA